MRRSNLRKNRIPDADHAPGKEAGPQAALAREEAQHLRMGPLGEEAARLAEFEAFEQRLTHAKSPSHQVVQAIAARHDVAAGRVGTHLLPRDLGERPVVLPLESRLPAMTSLVGVPAGLTICALPAPPPPLS